MGLDPRVVVEGLMPKPNVQGGTVANPTPDMADQMKKDLQEIERMKMIRHAMKEEPALPPPQPDKIGANVDKIADAFSGIYQSSLKQITDLLITFIQSNSQRQADPALQELLHRMTTMQQQKDPTEFIRQYKGMITEMKEELGLSHLHTAGTPQEMQIAVQLKMMEKEMQERGHQWQVEREERLHQWEIENKRWEQDYQMKKDELKKSGEKQENMMTTLKTLAVSLVDSIDQRTGGAAPFSQPAPTPAYAATAEPSVPRVEFNCWKCGTKISVLAGTPSVTCSKCGQTYREKPDEEPRQAPQPAAAPEPKIESPQDVSAQNVIQEPITDGTTGQAQAA